MCLAAVRAGKAGSQADRRFARELDADALEAALAACGARFVTLGSAEYPQCFAGLTDPPAAIFVRGREIDRLGPSVAIVGARNCSELGRELARSLGRALGAAGSWVVSGAARGIDAAAHEGALEVGGATVAVLGCGIDAAYPPASRSLLARIARTGTVVSEYPPGVPAEPFRFPARNRILAALGAALVVVEGAAGSGSLITTDHALDLGRPIFAVAGAVNNPLAEAPLALIRDGAVLIRGPDDLIHDLGLSARGPRGDAAAREMTVAEETAFSLLAGPVLPEVVARGMGISVPEVIPVLMSLEMKGLVRSVGGRFEQRARVEG